VAVALRMDDETGRRAGRVCPLARGRVRCGIFDLVGAGSHTFAAWGCGRARWGMSSGSCEAGMCASVGRVCG